VLRVLFSCSRHGGEYHSHPGRFDPGEHNAYTLNRRQGEPQGPVWTLWRREIFLQHRDERKITTSALITVTERHYNSPDVREIITPRDSYHLPWKLHCWPLFLCWLVFCLFIFIPSLRAYCSTISELSTGPIASH